MHEDALLVRQALLGNESSYCRLIQKYHNSIYALILSIVKNPQDAEELVNDVFLKAYQNLGALKRPLSFHAWISQIARNSCMDWLRQHSETSVSLENLTDRVPFSVSSLEDNLIQQERVDKVLDAIRALPRTERQLIEDYYFNGDTYKILQQRYGLSKDAIRMRLHKARQKIKYRVKDLLGISAFLYRQTFKRSMVGKATMKVQARLEKMLIAFGIITLITIFGVWFSQYFTVETPVTVINYATQKLASRSHKINQNTFYKDTPIERQEHDNHSTETSKKQYSPETVSVNSFINYNQPKLSYGKVIWRQINYWQYDKKIKSIMKYDSGSTLSGVVALQTKMSGNISDEELLSFLRNMSPDFYFVIMHKVEFDLKSIPDIDEKADTSGDSYANIRLRKIKDKEGNINYFEISYHVKNESEDGSGEYTFGTNGETICYSEGNPWIDINGEVDEASLHPGYMHFVSYSDAH